MDLFLVVFLLTVIQNAFIAETLRYKGVFPLGIPHVALCDHQLDNYHIKKDTYVLGNLLAITRDPNLWPKPDVFDPNRFLDKDNKYMSALPGFTPFGIGRRICLGEKLALADLFYITVRLLKSTPDYVFALPSGEGTADLEPDPNIFFRRAPNPYEIILKKR
ncbi:unnamed protein product [Oppiella nova]|uniref:Cytochrome P450 n=1 Tax=Oppiella nova TaxID=334625 RepID=A0A7R9QQA2_9ACAR|nr:unnamed protein product [Oppiella nova]CAG2170386.1 unnamed protein product [Oppiella nova]